MMDFLFNTLGHIGVISFLIAYFLLQKGTLKPDGYPYLFLNLAGAILLMISLTWEWNLPAFLLEAFWAVISVYGLYKRRFRQPSTVNRRPL